MGRSRGAREPGGLIHQLLLNLWVVSSETARPRPISMREYSAAVRVKGGDVAGPLRRFAGVEICQGA